MTITTEIVTVTPEKAVDWLANHNPRNRSVAKSAVSLYARQMQDGQWMLNGEAIQFDTNDDLLNGQHRLHAVVESGCNVDFLVVYGLPPEVRDTMDQHRKRTAADVLGMHGFRDGSHVAAVTRVIRRWDEGTRGPALMGGGHLGSTPSELLDVLAKEPAIVEAVGIARTKDFETLAPSRVVAPLWVLTHRLDTGCADDFFRHLGSGEMLEGGNPILALRRYWMRDSRRRVRASDSFTYFNAAVRAWNAWSRGEQMRNIAWKNPNVPEIARPARRTDKP
jgi:hypothetical protein